jgi:hypothetical protein
MSNGSAGVPDLLRRFAPAPYCASLAIGDAAIELRTNDVDLLAAMRRAALAHTNGQHATSLFVKVIRDCDAPSVGSQLTLLSAWPLATLLLGTGTVLTIDCERHEIVGFLAPAVAAERFVHELLPMLLDFLRRGEASTTPQQRAHPL